MTGRGQSVRVHTASGAPTDVIGVVTRVWTNEATGEQHATIAAFHRRWEGPTSMLRAIEQIDLGSQLRLTGANR